MHFARAIRIQNRSMLMRMIVPVIMVVLMVMIVVVRMLVAFVCVRPFRRFRIGIVFEGVGRTQRVAFQARKRRR